MIDQRASFDLPSNTKCCRSLRRTFIRGVAGLSALLCLAQPAVAQLKWGNQGSECRGSQRVDYARLWGLSPFGPDWVETCKKTPASNISKRSNGKLPSMCRQDAAGAVWAEWRYSSHASCVPKANWGEVSAYQCVRGKAERIYGARLWNDTGDAMADCRSTPVSFKDKNGKTHTFGGGENCHVKVLQGVWSEWKVPDESCAPKPYWGPTKADQCVSKGLRKHSAMLHGSPAGDAAYPFCADTPLMRDGREAYAVKCVLVAGLENMWGEWVFPDSSCRGARWDTPKKDYCTGPNKRQHSAILRDIPAGQSWEVACRETAMRISGQAFDRPSRCQRDFEMWGEFDVPDASCTRDERSQADRRADEDIEELDNQIALLEDISRFDERVRLVTEPDRAEILLRDLLNQDSVRNEGYDTAAMMISTGGSLVVGYDHADGLVMTRDGSDAYSCYRTWSNTFTGGAQAGGGGAGIVSLSRGGIDRFKGESNGFVMGGSVGPVGYTSGFHWTVGNNDPKPDVIAYQPGLAAGFELQIAYAHTWTDVGEKVACNFSQ